MAAATVSFSPLEPLPGLPRSGACATTLPSRGVLIFGGYTEDPQDRQRRAPTNEAWLFDGRRWERVGGEGGGGGVPEPRLAAQLVEVGGKAWLFGGWNSSKSGPEAFLGDVWVLDPGAGWAWERVELSGEPLGGVSRFQAAAIGGGMVVLHTHRTTDHVLVVDTAARTLSRQPVHGPAPSSRGLHSLVRAGGGGSLLLFGGAPQSGPMLDDLWRLDLATWTWEQLQPAGERPPARCSAAAAAVRGGRAMLVVGGAFYGASGGLEMVDDAWLFDAEASTWSRAAVQGTPPRARNAAVISPLPADTAAGGSGGGERLLLHGGWRAFVETYADTFEVLVAP